MPDVFLMMEVKSGKLGNWPHGGRGPGGHLCLCVKTQRLLWRDGWSTGLVLEAFRTKQFYTDDVISHDMQEYVEDFPEKSITK